MEKAPPASMEKRMNNKAILIVDDEPFLRSTMAMILGRVGYSIREAANAQEALQALDKCKFDLIFLDLKMPGRDGLDLLPEITAQYPETPVLILTADGSLEKAIEALRIGARDYLLKPVDPGQIVIRVDDLLKESPQAGSTSSAQKESRPDRPTKESMVNDAGCSSKAHPEAFLERGPFRLDFRAHKAFLNNEALDLDNCTFEYLATLLKHTPHPVDYETLVSESQGYQLSHEQAQDVCRWRIHRLWKIIESEPLEPRYVLTVPGFGYLLKT
jgi:DNA-binding response OmpR family regulator